jgi:hypothetical protein
MKTKNKRKNDGSLAQGSPEKKKSKLEKKYLDIVLAGDDVNQIEDDFEKVYLSEEMDFEPINYSEIDAPFTGDAENFSKAEEALESEDSPLGELIKASNFFYEQEKETGSSLDKKTNSENISNHAITDAEEIFNLVLEGKNEEALNRLGFEKEILDKAKENLEHSFEYSFQEGSGVANFRKLFLNLFGHSDLKYQQVLLCKFASVKFENGGYVLRNVDINEDLQYLLYLTYFNSKLFVRSSEMVAAIIDAGVDLNVRNTTSNQIYTLLNSLDYPFVIMNSLFLRVQKGEFDINSAIDSEGSTILIQLVKKKARGQGFLINHKTEVLKKLLGNGANPFVKDKDGNDAIDYADIHIQNEINTYLNDNPNKFVPQDKAVDNSIEFNNINKIRQNIKIYLSLNSFNEVFAELDKLGSRGYLDHPKINIPRDEVFVIDLKKILEKIQVSAKNKNLLIKLINFIRDRSQQILSLNYYERDEIGKASYLYPRLFISMWKNGFDCLNIKTDRGNTFFESAYVMPRYPQAISRFILEEASEEIRQKIAKTIGIDGFKKLITKEVNAHLILGTKKLAIEAMLKTGIDKNALTPDVQIILETYTSKDVIVNYVFEQKLGNPIIKYAQEIVNKFEVEYFNSLASTPKWVQEELVKVIENDGFEAFARDFAPKENDPKISSNLDGLILARNGIEALDSVNYILGKIFGLNFTINVPDKMQFMIHGAINFALAYTIDLPGVSFIYKAGAAVSSSASFCLGKTYPLVSFALQIASLAIEKYTIPNMPVKAKMIGLIPSATKLAMSYMGDKFIKSVKDQASFDVVKALEVQIVADGLKSMIGCASTPDPFNCIATEALYRVDSIHSTDFIGKNLVGLSEYLINE